MICEWCEQPFQPRRGGSPQRFCGPKCRSAFWSGLRRWGERAVVAGIVTVGDIRNGAAAACTLLPRGISTAPADEAAPQSPSPAATRAASDYTRQKNLEQAMARHIALRRRG